MRVLSACFLLILFAAFVGAERAIELESESRIQHRLLDRPSSLTYWQGGWWAVMERDGPLLYRADDHTFDVIEAMSLPGANNRGWSALAVMGEDLLVCDIGNIGGDREEVTVYRVSLDDGNLKSPATYTLRWPGARHDAAAATVINDRLHIITRSRGTQPTYIYRAPELSADEPVKLERVGAVDIPAAELIRDATECPKTGRLLLLGRVRVYVLDADKLEAEPIHSTRYHAGVTEAMALHNDTLLLVNRRGRVFALPNFLSEPAAEALQPTPEVTLPVIETEFEPDGTGDRWRDHAADIPLPGLKEGEYLRWCVGGAYLMVAGRVRYDGGFVSSSEHGPRRGSAVILAIARERTDFRTPEQAVFWFGDNGVTGVDMWRLGTPDMGLSLVPGFAAMGDVRDSMFMFEYSIPLTAAFGEGALPQEFAVNALTFSLREDDPALAGTGVQVIEHPFAWAKGTLKPEE
jgi:hypothetical protein